MIIRLRKDITSQEKKEIIDAVLELKYKPSEVKTQFGAYLVCTGKKEFDIRKIGFMPGVGDVHRVSSQYKLVSRQWKVDNTIIDLGDGVKIKRDELAILAGPCSIESIENAEKTIEHLVKNNIKIMRTMVFKPRSSPYSFRGIGIEGLRTVSGMCKANGIKIISEVMQVSQIEEMADYVDIFQVGARNTQNFNLLDALGEVDKPVLLKRGISGTIEELLQSAEYIFSNGNEKIILCERGIRTFEDAYRNTFDLNAIPILKEKSHLPVVADPSHAIGIRMFVAQMALASVMAGADGILLEVHETPEKAFSDAQQTLQFTDAEHLYECLRKTNALRNEIKYSMTD
ncbi:MAG: bifunctional 3-deoxy-7-phosphoheptulonate synthase/chorismate mutase [Bacteroidales bacterium]|nr:bifunctional 3-deoxy-7-phosphoheptulonate synthase/chorismate mutase [Bacteroidales bacterium]